MKVPKPKVFLAAFLAAGGGAAFSQGGAIRFGDYWSGLLWCAVSALIGIAIAHWVGLLAKWLRGRFRRRRTVP